MDTSTLLLIFMVGIAFTSAQDVPDIYANCETTVCFGVRTGYDENECIPSKDCEMVAAWTDDGSSSLRFEVQAFSPAITQPWVGIAFSLDDNMGDDAAVISNADSTKTYWNVEFDNSLQYAFPTGDKDVARPVSTATADGTFYSAFDIDQQFQITNPLTNETENFDLSAGEAYHLLLAVGEMGESSLVPEAGEVPQKHYYKAASFNPITFVSNDKLPATDSTASTSETTSTSKTTTSTTTSPTEST